jgi:hypothetical protein
MINHPTTLSYNRINDNQAIAAGYPAWIIHYKVTRLFASQTILGEGLAIGIMKGNEGYHLQYEAGKTLFKKYLPDIQKMLDSIRRISF